MSVDLLDKCIIGHLGVACTLDNITCGHWSIGWWQLVNFIYLFYFLRALG